MMNFKNLRSFIAMFVVAAALLGLASCSKDDSTSPNTNGKAQITSFKFADFSPVIEGVIDQSAKTIKLTVPSITDVTSLKPTIVVSEGATVSPATGEIKDFTTPVVYTVTGSDGSKNAYTVTVTKTAPTWEEIKGNIDQNKVLVDRGPGIDYIVNEYIYIEGAALLTIEPGVTIVFNNSSAGFEIGVNAGLKIAGTSDKPVIFTGPVNNQNKGSWAGITIKSPRADNVWDYVTLENGGSSSNGSALELASDAKMTMRNCTIKGSLNFGIYMGGGATFMEFKNNTVTKNENVPVSTDQVSDIKTFDMTSNFTGNAQDYDAVLVRGYESFNNNFTLRKINVPYVLSSLEVTGGTFTIEPGVTMLYGNDGYLWIRESGKLIADGSATDKITFGSASGNPGSWQGVFVENKQANSIKNAVIDRGGKDDYANLDITSGKITLENILISNSLNYGVKFNEESVYTQSGITFKGNENGDVYNESTQEILTALP